MRLKIRCVLGDIGIVNIAADYEETLKGWLGVGYLKCDLAGVLAAVSVGSVAVFRAWNRRWLAPTAD
jgi:hypothetical protein